MAKLNTAAEARAFWTNSAERHEREAATVPPSRPSHKDYWLRRAAEARAKAATYTA